MPWGQWSQPGLWGQMGTAGSLHLHLVSRPVPQGGKDGEAGLEGKDTFVSYWLSSWGAVGQEDTGLHRQRLLGWEAHRQDPKLWCRPSSV